MINRLADLLELLEPRFKYISSDDGRTDGQTSRVTT